MQVQPRGDGRKVARLTRHWCLKCQNVQSAKFTPTVGSTFPLVSRPDNTTPYETNVTSCSVLI